MVNANAEIESTLQSKGEVLSVSGTIVDVQFPRESAPNILNELLIEFPDACNINNGKH